MHVTPQNTTLIASRGTLPSLFSFADICVCQCAKLRFCTFCTPVFVAMDVNSFGTVAKLKKCHALNHCCNLSGGVALIVWFTTNGMCAKNKNVCMWSEQAIIEWSRWSDLGEWPLMMLVHLVNSWLCLLTVTTRVISSGDIYCCLLPRCEALRTCHLGFPIATPLNERNHLALSFQLHNVIIHTNFIMTIINT